MEHHATKLNPLRPMHAGKSVLEAAQCVETAPTAQPMLQAYIENDPRWTLYRALYPRP
jgi:hypothetical protein